MKTKHHVGKGKPVTFKEFPYAGEDPRLSPGGQLKGIRTPPKQMNPWVPITDIASLKRLSKLIEELGECSAAAARCIAQGVDGKEPVTGKVNRLWLTEEIADVLALIDKSIEFLQAGSRLH